MFLCTIYNFKLIFESFEQKIWEQMNLKCIILFFSFSFHSIPLFAVGAKIIQERRHKKNEQKTFSKQVHILN